MLVEERDGEMYVLVDQLEGEGYYGGKYNKKTKEYRYRCTKCGKIKTKQSGKNKNRKVRRSKGKTGN